MIHYDDDGAFEEAYWEDGTTSLELKSFSQANRTNFHFRLNDDDDNRNSITMLADRELLQDIRTGINAALGDDENLATLANWVHSHTSLDVPEEIRPLYDAAYDYLKGLSR